MLLALELVAFNKDGQVHTRGHGHVVLSRHPVHLQLARRRRHCAGIKTNARDAAMAVASPSTEYGKSKVARAFEADWRSGFNSQGQNIFPRIFPKVQFDFFIVTF